MVRCGFVFSRRYARASGEGWLACFRWGGICWCAWWDPASCRKWRGRTCRETPGSRRAGGAGVAPDSPGWAASLRKPDTRDSPRGSDWAEPGFGCPPKARCRGSPRCAKPLRGADFGAPGVPGCASSGRLGAWTSSRSAGSRRARRRSWTLTDPDSGSLCRRGTHRGTAWRAGGLVWARLARAVCASAGGRPGSPDSWRPSRTRDNLYSTRTIREHLCCARENGSEYSSLQSWQMNSPRGLLVLPENARGFSSTGPSLIFRPSTGDVVTSSSKLSLRMALGFLALLLLLRSAASEEGLLAPVRMTGAVPLRLLLLVPIFKSTGANRRWWSRLVREAGVGNDSAETGEPRLRLLSKYFLSCSLLMGRVGLYRAWYTVSGLPNCTGLALWTGTGASAPSDGNAEVMLSGLEALGAGGGQAICAIWHSGADPPSSSERIRYETSVAFLFLFTRNPLGMMRRGWQGTTRRDPELQTRRPPPSLWEMLLLLDA